MSINTMICSKERELGIMATQIQNIKETTDRVETKMDTFIDKADKTYATKEELHKAINSLSNYDKIQDRKSNWLSKNWFQLLQIILFVCGVLYIYLINLLL